MTEERRCQEVTRWRGPYVDAECGAIIPRLDGEDGEDCVVCGEQRWENAHILTGSDDHHHYLGPYADTCTEGHTQPVEAR